MLFIMYGDIVKKLAVTPLVVLLAGLVTLGYIPIVLATHTPPSVELKAGYPQETFSGSGYWKWVYTVYTGIKPSLSHLVIEIDPFCDPPEIAFQLDQCGTDYSGVVTITIETDPTTGKRGLKFDFKGNLPENTYYEIWFVLNANYPAGDGGDGSDGTGGIEFWFKSGGGENIHIGNQMVEGPDSMNFCIPEVPYGTMSIIIASLVALGLFTRAREIRDPHI